MTDTGNLSAASLYINNQLVSRGLLRDGQTIDFAQIFDNGRGSAATAGRVISLVNDLILRRDRDAEQRESLSGAMRSLRAENERQASDIARLTEKNAEERRRADLGSAAEAALRTQLKTAEAAARGQKDEIARCKALVSQTRSACAIEVRRRDRQIETLKKQLAEAGRSRGSKANPSTTTIHVTGDFGAEAKSAAPGGGSGEAGASLRDETNAFLAKLAHDLCEENEAIVGAMRHTVSQLREMSEWPEAEQQASDVVRQPSCDELVADLAQVTAHMRNILTNPSFVPIEEVVVRDEAINRLRSGWVKMESRWKEAVLLIDGWRKRMAASGRPVCDEELKMGLRLSPVRVKNVDETRGALDAGLPVVAEDEEEAAEAARQSPCPPGRARAEPDDDQESADFEHNITVVEQDSEPEAAAEDSRYQTSVDSSPLPEPPQLSPLRNSASAGNRGALLDGRSRPKLGDFTTIVEERTQELAAESKPVRPLTLPSQSPAAAAHTRLLSRAPEPPQRARSPSHTSLDEVLLARPPRPGRLTAHRDVGAEGSARGRDEERRAGSGREDGHRAPARSEYDDDTAESDDDDDADELCDRPSHHSPPPTKASIAAKLAASEKEADAARVRAKLQAARSSRGGVARPTTTTTASKTAPAPSKPTSKLEDVDPVKHDVAAPPPPPPPPHQELPLSGAGDRPPRPMEKRKRDRATSRAASRRRSTLSPWELQALISGGGETAEQRP